MLRMLIDRLAFSILALLFVGLLLFVLTRGVPGSPARVALGLEATDTQIAQFEKDAATPAILIGRPDQGG